MGIITLDLVKTWVYSDANIISCEYQTVFPSENNARLTGAAGKESESSNGSSEIQWPSSKDHSTCEWHEMVLVNRAKTNSREDDPSALHRSEADVPRLPRCHAQAAKLGRMTVDAWSVNASDAEKSEL